MKISIVGLGYVGLSLAILISQKFRVFAYDIDSDRVKSINEKISPIKDTYLKDYLNTKELNLVASSNKKEVYLDADYLIVATPTNYDEETGSFDTSSVEEVVSDFTELNNKGTIVIKSTIPFGYTDTLRHLYPNNLIFFSPEFLRESNALYDNLYPSRIIVGDLSKKARDFAEILSKCSLTEKENTILQMTSKEAESVKLFANTYLAMRIAFFNELDSFSEFNNLSTENVVKGVSLDDRIGNYYNNPSFGYGGYCLPKDTKQLLKNFKDLPNNIIQAVVEANQTRKNFIVNSILQKKPKTVGIYRLIMKSDSDNFRESAVLDIVQALSSNNIRTIIFEPLLTKVFNNIEIVNDFEKFTKEADLIIANRTSKELKNVKKKVYTRDLFSEN